MVISKVLLGWVSWLSSSGLSSLTQGFMSSRPASKAGRMCSCKNHVVFYIFPSIPGRISFVSHWIELCYGPSCSPSDVRAAGSRVGSQRKWNCHHCHCGPIKTHPLALGEERIFSEVKESPWVVGWAVSLKNVCPSPNLPHL